MLKKVAKRIFNTSVYTFTNNGKGNQHIDIPCKAQKQIGQTHKAHQQTQIIQKIARPRIMDKFKANVTGIVAILILALSYAILFSIIFWDFPSDQKDIYFTIAGGVTSIVTMVVSFYFGASKKQDEN
jgi:hypothetical protein